MKPVRPIDPHVDYNELILLQQNWCYVTIGPFVKEGLKGWKLARRPFCEGAAGVIPCNEHKNLNSLRGSISVLDISCSVDGISIRRFQNPLIRNMNRLSQYSSLRTYSDNPSSRPAIRLKQRSMVGEHSMQYY